jgi:hypothetical protein
MKILSKIYVFIFISLISCTSDINDSDFIGKWSIIEYNTDNTKGLSPELIKGVKEVAMNSIYLITRIKLLVPKSTQTQIKALGNSIKNLKY